MKRIFILSRRSIFSEGLETLLDSQPGLDVIGCESDIEKAILRLKELQPDAILYLDSSRGDSSVRSRILEQCPGVKFIRLNLDDNTCSITHDEQRTLARVQDFIQALESDPQ